MVSGGTGVSVSIKPTRVTGTHTVMCTIRILPYTLVSCSSLCRRFLFICLNTSLLSAIYSSALPTDFLTEYMARMFLKMINAIEKIRTSARNKGTMNTTNRR